MNKDKNRREENKGGGEENKILTRRGKSYYVFYHHETDMVQYKLIQYKYSAKLWPVRRCLGMYFDVTITKD